MNMLLVGVDSRAGLTPDQVEEYATGDPDGLHNTDTMMLVHIPADGSAASFVSFPRDMYVSIPGHGKAKLNSAYSYGYDEVDESGSEDEKRAAGARLLIQTISQLSGLQIDHYAEINLLGFINLTSIVGGVDVDLCESSDDSVTGAHFDAGPQTLTGSQALLFVRQRHGVGARSSDFDRVARQQVFIAGMLRNMLSSDLMLNPGKQQQVVQQVGSSVTLDQGLDIFQLAAQMQNVRPDAITFQTIPGLTSVDVDGSSVLKLPPAQVLRDRADLGRFPGQQRRQRRGERGDHDRPPHRRRGRGRDAGRPGPRRRTGRRRHPGPGRGDADAGHRLLRCRHRGGRTGRPHRGAGRARRLRQPRAHRRRHQLHQLAEGPPFGPIG
jgi:LCP family protein required for cell wall assembly